MAAERLLLADDEDLFAETTRDLLIDAGYECDRVADAAAALAALDHRVYDLVITDLRMPGNIDLELIRRLSAARKGMPVIIVTGYASLRTAIEAIDLPVTGYLVKPFEFDELLKRVKAGIQRRQLYMRAAALVEDANCFARDVATAPQWLMESPGLKQPETSLTFLIRAAESGLRSIFDLVRMLSLLDGSAPALDRIPCEVGNCPRHERYRALIQDAVDTLVRTKSSFKSAELGALRHKLQSALDQDRG